MRSNNSLLKKEEYKNFSNSETVRELAEHKFIFIDGSKFLALINSDKFDQQDIAEFQASWNDLKPDTYMADGGKYRLRRHATLSALPQGGAVVVE